MAGIHQLVRRATIPYLVNTSFIILCHSGVILQGVQ